MKGPLSITIRPSASRAWDAHAAQTKAYDVEYSPGRVITCAKDDMPDVVEGLLIKEADRG